MTRLLSGCVLGVVACLAAGGPIQPPVGPVASTMRTLDEIEVRTPIASLPYTIDEPGSYYLTGDLTTATNGIIVQASDVTIDLMGFSIVGPGPTAPNSNAVLVFSNTDENVTVRNGTIRSFELGVNADFLEMGNATVVEDMRLLDIGGAAINLRGTNNVVRNCVAASAGLKPPAAAGINATNAVIEGCIVGGFDTGISTTNGVISKCVTTGGQIGILCSDSLVTECSATGASADNLLLFGSAIAVDTHAP